MDDKELKPCPFCGGEGNSVYAPCDYNRWGVYCTQCGNTIEVDNGYGGWPDTEKAAIRRWNTRPIEDALQEENAELKSQLEVSTALIEKLENYLNVAINATAYVKPNTGIWHTLGISLDAIKQWRGTKEVEDGTKVD